jgi:hypothetical protein
MTAKPIFLTFAVKLASCEVLNVLTPVSLTKRRMTEAVYETMHIGVGTVFGGAHAPILSKQGGGKTIYMFI